MKRRFDNEHCAVAKALDILGDGWTMLVIREAFFGARRFADFEARLQISKNILSDRLRHLVDHGVLEKVDVGQHGTRFEYRLANMGKDLVTVLTALRQWGDRWIYGEGNEPMLVHDRKTGRPIGKLRICDDDGYPLASSDMAVVPGPGSLDSGSD